MTQKYPYCKSTIAMSAYNAIAINTGSANISIIFDTLMRTQHPDLEIIFLEKSLKKLLKKKYVNKNKEIYSLKDKRRRLIVTRDLSDVIVDKDGMPRGGWNRWMARDVMKGLVPIEEIIK